MLPLCGLGSLARKISRDSNSFLAKPQRAQRLRKGLARSEQGVSKDIKVFATFAAWREKTREKMFLSRKAYRFLLAEPRSLLSRGVIASEN